MTDRVRCPICGAAAEEVLARYTTSEAASAFAPEDRDRERRLERLLREMWAPAERVEVRRCDACMFAFAWPQVAGSPAFYSLLTGEAPAYPHDRWEFGVTVEALGALDGGRLLEIGAGSGWFLKRVRDTWGERWAGEAIEFDAGAVRELAAAGFPARIVSLDDLAQEEAAQQRYDVVCLFQTLEHLDRPRDRLAAIHRVLAPGGHVFLSVPNDVATRLQERLTGMPDMPPNHVGGWTPRALERLFERTGFSLEEVRLSDETTADESARLGHYAMVMDVRTGRSLAGRAARRISGRPGAALRLLIARRHARRIAHRHPVLPPNDIWAHARRPS